MDGSLEKRWMRDERTPKDVCGEAKLNCLKKKIMQTKSDQKNILTEGELTFKV